MQRLEQITKDHPQVRKLISDIFDELLAIGIRNMIGCDKDLAMSNRRINEKIEQLREFCTIPVPLPELRKMVWEHCLNMTRRSQ